jgi:Amt family ammonium transporter
MRDGSVGILSQFGVQIIAVLVAILYAAVVTFVITLAIEKTIGLRASDEEELRGLDHSQHGERAYAMLNAD